MRRDLKSADNYLVAAAAGHQRFHRDLVARPAHEEEPSPGVREVHHHLRTALTSIMGFAHLIENETCGTGVPRRYRDFAAHILESSRNILDLVEPSSR